MDRTQHQSAALRRKRIHPFRFTPPHRHVLKATGERSIEVMITAVVISPWAPQTTRDEIEQLMRDNGYTIPVQLSELARYRALLPWLRRARTAPLPHPGGTRQPDADSPHVGIEASAFARKVEA